MSRPRLLRVLAALGLLHLVAVQPNHPLGAYWSIRMLPLEVPVIAVGLAFLPAGTRLTDAVRGALVIALVTVSLLKLGDFGTFVAYNRPFTLAMDHHLIHAGWMLTQGSVGTIQAGLLALLVVAAIAAVALALWWATGQLATLGPPRRLRRPLAVFGLLAAGVGIAETGHALQWWRLPVRPDPATAFTARVGIEHAMRNIQTVRELDRFRRLAAIDPFPGMDGLLLGLDGHDLIIVYVESYGRSSFENPLYAGTHPATLREIEARLDAEGLAMRSGWLTAPMVGGQSWLAHASVASGLWISDQGRYRALLASPRRTLFHIGREAGFRTVAIKPAHVFDWPEGDFFGFDAIYNTADLGYAGRRFNWATMPDQFTLAAFDRLERRRADRRPLIAQIALVSSHAPFLPVPPVIDWDEIGDGRVFNRWADDGDPPEVVWRDPDRVREKFRLAVDYSLRAVGSYAGRLAGERALLIVLGDHEPAPFISGVEGFDVPVHVVGPAHLVDRFADWGWRPGLVPDPDVPAKRMDAVRDALLRSFGGPGS